MFASGGNGENTRFGFEFKTPNQSEAPPSSLLPGMPTMIAHLRLVPSPAREHIDRRARRDLRYCSRDLILVTKNLDRNRDCHLKVAFNKRLLGSHIDEGGVTLPEPLEHRAQVRLECPRLGKTGFVKVEEQIFNFVFAE